MEGIFFMAAVVLVFIASLFFFSAIRQRRNYRAVEFEMNRGEIMREQRQLERQFAEMIDDESRNSCIDPHYAMELKAKAGVLLYGHFAKKAHGLPNTGLPEKEIVLVPRQTKETLLCPEREDEASATQLRMTPARTPRAAGPVQCLTR
jgi:hypothetical protein